MFKFPFALFWGDKMDFLVAVTRHEFGDSLVVDVTNAENEYHARLAAYYHVHLNYNEPSRITLASSTTILKSGGPVSANFFTNPFKDLTKS